MPNGAERSHGHDPPGLEGALVEMNPVRTPFHLSADALLRSPLLASRGLSVHSACFAGRMPNGPAQTIVTLTSHSMTPVAMA